MCTTLRTPLPALEILFSAQTEPVQSFQSLALFTCFCGSLKGNGWGVNWLSKLRSSSGHAGVRAMSWLEQINGEELQLAPLKDFSQRLSHKKGKRPLTELKDLRTFNFGLIQIMRSFLVLSCWESVKYLLSWLEWVKLFLCPGFPSWGQLYAHCNVSTSTSQLPFVCFCLSLHSTRHHHH